MKFEDFQVVGTVNKSLSLLLQRHRILQLESARYIIVDILIGLHHLPSIGLLHGDSKPQNVLIDANNRAIIGDFGFVLDFKKKPQKGIYGTPLYQSPEQLEEKYHLDERVDIFNVRVIFYEMIVGRHPFSILDNFLETSTNIISLKYDMPKI